MATALLSLYEESEGEDGTIVQHKLTWESDS